MLRRLNRSQTAVALLGRWWLARGWDVFVAPLRAAPTASEWQQYADKGDLWVRGGVPTRAQRIEAKHLSVEFKSLLSWPFPDFIACGRGSWDRADTKPWRIFIFAKNLQHVAVVDQQTRPWWQAIERYDAGMRLTMAFYLCPLSLVTFMPVPTDLFQETPHD